MRRLRRFFSHWQNWLAFFLVLAFTFVAVAAPFLSPKDPKNPGIFKVVGQFSDTQPRPPNAQAPLGTLPGQKSVYHTLIWGTRDALRFGLEVTLFTACFGILFGAVAGYIGGAINRLMMRVADAFLTFPVIAGVVLLQQLLLSAYFPHGRSILDIWLGLPTTGADSLVQILLSHIDPLMLSLILFSWMPYARMVNTLVVGLKQAEYVVAARAVGVRPARILYRHILPNAIPPAIVFVARDIGSVVIFQATLTFIGLSGGSPWGSLLALGRDWIIGPGGNILAYWWTFIPATLAVILFGITWNLLGDGLSEILDPRTA